MTDDSELRHAAEHLALLSGDMTGPIMAGLFGGDVERLDPRVELDAAVARDHRQARTERDDTTGT